jgi:hypothetical protein
MSTKRAPARSATASTTRCSHGSEAAVASNLQIEPRTSPRAPSGRVKTIARAARRRAIAPRLRPRGLCHRSRRRTGWDRRRGRRRCGNKRRQQRRQADRQRAHVTAPSLPVSSIPRITHKNNKNKMTTSFIASLPRYRSPTIQICQAAMSPVPLRIAVVSASLGFRRPRRCSDRHMGCKTAVLNAINGGRAGVG